MKVNAISAIKHAALFLLIFYVDAQLLNKLFAVKSVGDAIVYLVSLTFMLAVLTVQASTMHATLSNKERETKND